MESNGKPNKIQLSQETADLLTATGKGHWVSAREDKVYAKGKGELSTFWLNVIEDDAKSSTMSRSSYATSEFSTDDETPLPAIQCNKTRRLIEWNCDVLLKLLKQIAERRQLTGIKPDTPEDIASQEAEQVTNGHTILDEVEDTIELPTYCQIDVDKMNLQELKMDEAVQTQLSEFIGTLAAMYHDNPFHNFEHASVSRHFLVLNALYIRIPESI